MKRRSFLAMLGFAPVAGVATINATTANSPSLNKIVEATGPESPLAVRYGELSLAYADIGTVRASGVFRTAMMREPYLFDANGVCLNP